MFIRFEKIQRREGLSSVIDENNKYLGDIDELNLLECLDLDKNFEEKNILKDEVIDDVEEKIEEGTENVEDFENEIINYFKRI